MDQWDILQAAGGEFSKRVRNVSAEQYDEPSNCGDWTVRQLIEHVVGGNLMATILAKGGSREAALEPFKRGDVLRNNASEAFNGSFRTMLDALKRPGVLDKTVHHPAMDMPGRQLFQFRLADVALHGWDLARSTGQDEALSPIVVQALWDSFQPMAPMMKQSGVFGDGPSGNVADTAPLQERLLDLTGRRP